MAVSGIDLTTLTLRDALDLAILVEEEAEERYKEFASQMELHHTPEAARFFRFMAENEAKHGAELAERRRELFQNAPSAVTRAMLWDVEAPAYDEARAFMSTRASSLRRPRRRIEPQPPRTVLLVRLITPNHFIDPCFRHR